MIMRKHTALITIIAALVAGLFLAPSGLNAQAGRASQLAGIGLNGYIEQTDFDSLHIVTDGLWINDVQVTAAADELNYLDITTLGTGAASKAVVLDAGDDYTWPTAGFLTYGGTQITANGAEVNYLDIATLGTGAASKAVVLDAGDDYTWPATGVFSYAVLNDGSNDITATAAEVNYLDITTLGTGAASKAVVLDAGDDYTWPTAGMLTYGGGQITATGTEINYLDIATLGTGVASKAVVLDAGDDYTWPATGVLTYSVLNDGTTELSATVLELNVLDGIAATLTYSELDILDGVTATSGEINVLASVTAGTAAASKAVVLDGSSKIDALDITSLTLNGSAVTATAADLNAIPVTTSSAAELNYLDLTTGPGTQEASKAVVADANVNTGVSKITELHIGATGSETQVTSTGAELNVLDGIAATLTYDELDYLDVAAVGTQEASKAVIADANVNTGISKVTELHIGATGSEIQVTATPAELNYVADKSASIIDATTTLSVTAALHSERIILLNAAAGFTSTLPVATGTGNKYTFIVQTTITSANYIIKVADDTDVMAGAAIVANDAAPAMMQAWLTASDSDTITMDGSTKGGIIGDKITLIDVATDLWYVEITGRQTGTEATPFSATV